MIQARHFVNEYHRSDPISSPSVYHQEEHITFCKYHNVNLNHVVKIISTMFLHCKVTIFVLFTINGKIMRLCKHTVIKLQPLALAYPFYKFRCEQFNKKWDPEERTEQRLLHLFNESQTILQKSQKDPSVLKKKCRDLHTSF